MFIKMMNRSKIAPDILLLGIDDYANQLDSIHQAELVRTDSIRYLGQQVDSLLGVHNRLDLQNDSAIQTIKNQRLFLWVGGLFLGVLIILLLIKYFKK